MGFEPCYYKKKVSAFNTQYSNIPILQHSIIPRVAGSSMGPDSLQFIAR